MSAHTPLQHGELILAPVPDSDIPAGAAVTYDTRVIVGHSETGHHHVLECDQPMAVHRTDTDSALFVRLFAPGRLVHVKEHDQHATLLADPVTYRVYQKREYRPFAKIVDLVRD